LIGEKNMRHSVKGKKMPKIAQTKYPRPEGKKPTTMGIGFVQMRSAYASKTKYHGGGQEKGMTAEW